MEGTRFLCTISDVLLIVDSSRVMPAQSAAQKPKSSGLFSDSDDDDAGQVFDTRMRTGSSISGQLLSLLCFIASVSYVKSSLVK